MPSSALTAELLDFTVYVIDEVAIQALPVTSVTNDKKW
jgi:hypothetical protein